MVKNEYYCEGFLGEYCGVEKHLNFAKFQNQCHEESFCARGRRWLNLTKTIQTLSSFHRRFGFANPEALANGETGTACRGEEHDVTLVWSITSGKRLLLVDGQEVHYSNSRGNVFDFSWTMRGNHVLKVVAHASPPLSSQPGFRQYNFYVNGQSFFTFPKVFRLGLAPNDPRGVGAPAYGGGYETMGQRSGPYQRSRSDNIASIEAPHDQEEVRLSLMVPSIVSILIHMLTQCTIIIGGCIPEGGNQNVVARVKSWSPTKWDGKRSVRTERRSKLARFL